MCVSGVGVRQWQASPAGAPSAAHQRGASQIPVLEERAGADQAAPDAGASHMDRRVYVNDIIFKLKPVKSMPFIYTMAQWFRGRFLP